ncbi:hypothetical protein [Nocardioides rubriscoriae]|uniref:hypothetical protein n=1 Tax=Nocardioides rubriscoriae TaxID=642762 RepID=UPI0011DF63BF|nr:hypothetical protein [Nocardioides rubriscoriae]
MTKQQVARHGHKNRKDPHDDDSYCVDPRNRARTRNPHAHTHPAQRGEAYVAVMRDLVEDHDDAVLYEHRLQELTRVTRPFDKMNADDLNQVLEGVHDALLALLTELIPDRRRTVRAHRDPVGL